MQDIESRNAMWDALENISTSSTTCPELLRYWAAKIVWRNGPHIDKADFLNNLLVFSTFPKIKDHLAAIQTVRVIMNDMDETTAMPQFYPHGKDGMLLAWEMPDRLLFLVIGSTGMFEVFKIKDGVVGMHRPMMHYHQGSLGEIQKYFPKVESVEA